MKHLRTILIAVGFALIIVGLHDLAHGQTNNIVASNHWTNPSHGWGGFQLRYWHGDPVSAAITPNNIVHGDGLQVILDQHTQAQASGAFTVHRTMYNFHGSNHANQVGLTFKEMTHWDGSRGWILDYDHAPNLVIVKRIEESVRAKAGHKIDAVQIGFGLLMENNFGPNPPPVSIDGMIKFYEVLYSVWGSKLQICIGGSYGTDANPGFTRTILKRIAATGRPFLSEFQDSYGVELWATMYQQAYGIWSTANVDAPIISWREVSGGPNAWLTTPGVRKPPSGLYAEYLDKRYSFLHNMSAWPTYTGTDNWIANVMQYLPSQVTAYRAAVGSAPDPPPVVEPPQLPPPDTLLTHRVDVLEVQVNKLNGQMEALQEWLKLAPVE